MQTNKKRKIILGGGIAGLIKAYFNPDAIIITDQIGGQFSSKFQLGPKYVHVDEYSSRFFKELGLNLPIKKIKIGFLYDGRLHSVNNEENRQRYFEKTRSGSGEPYKSVMSSNKTEFVSFDISVDEIVEEMKKKVNNKVILEKAAGIDTKNKKILTESGEIEYDELISTIPRNIFLFLCGRADMAKQFQTYPTTFVLNNSWTMPWSHDNISPFKDFDYVYVSETDYKFHRVTKTDKGPVYEFRGDNIEMMENEDDRVIMKVGQLVHNNIQLDYKNIEFFGRYATWNHSLLTNTLLKQEYDAIDYRGNK